MDVCNIKFHFHIKPECKQLFIEKLNECNFVQKRFSSFCVIRIGKIVYSCFYSGFVNVTGVLNFELKPVARKLLLSSLNLDQNENDVFMESVIDNITSRLHNPIKKKVNLVDKKLKLSLNEEILSVKYNRQRFPNMFIKTVFGTIIWSPNNFLSAVGSKSFSDLRKIYQIIQNLEQL